jgi:hypothetical protein
MLEKIGKYENLNIQILPINNDLHINEIHEIRIRFQIFKIKHYY